ncbi:DUF1059 domain-containing protein [Actinocorallia sp. API 0066]|uniref:DUF1059 domain-containing protein n=1 Tax=Actinocorallia sp. API 0066 TaxID=2896846 RepID=UPI001E40005B|nr:DUF1059 domain-containing protein [Actinocorallia sp. API 0066]MCD0447776.1 DUF1059 domain-containing protein [Actinocorallia sp. API 0066]
MFLQIVELETSQMPRVEALADGWAARTEGRRTAVRTTVAKDVGRPDHYRLLVEFPDQVAAKDNSALPETHEFAEKVRELARGPVVFHDLETVAVHELRDSGRKTVDCRAWPSEVGCSLAISGTPDEVVEAAVAHAVAVHGETDGPELREGIRSALKDEPYRR